MVNWFWIVRLITLLHIICINGSVKEYGNPNMRQMKKLWDCIETVKTGGKVACSISSSLPQLTFIQSIYDSDVETVDFPKIL